MNRHPSRLCSHRQACLLILPLLWLAQPLQAQLSVSDLAVLQPYESRRTSSYDRTGANRDYRSLDPGQTLTLFDEDGPGEIRHLWITLPPWSEVYAYQKVILRAYWDGESQPSVEAPIRFHKSIKVTIEDGHANSRSDNLYSVAYWYQLEPHRSFPPLPPVEKRIPKLAWTGGPGQDAEMK